MPILITCPECSTSLKAPENLAGRKVKCPKCGTHLSVPSVAAQAPPPAPSVVAVPPAPPRRAERDDEDDYEPRRPRRRRQYDDDDDDRRPRSREQTTNVQMGLGVASLCVGCVGIIFAAIPCLQFIGMPIAGVGLVLGAVGLIVALVRKRGLGFPVAGSSVNLVALVIGVIWIYVIGKAIDEGAQQLGKVAQAAKDVGQQIQKEIKEQQSRILPHERTRSENNLRQLALAMHSFSQQSTRLPHNASDGRSGKGQLSWRVAILPFVDQAPLHQQFRLNEPWDSPHNKQFLTRMPDIFKSPRSAASGTTYYQVFTGKGPFGRADAPRMPLSFSDGTGNTFLIAEAGTAVPWTRPEDLRFDGNQLPNLAGPYGNQFFAALADGTVRLFRFPDPYNDQLLRGIITPDGREPVNFPD